MKNLLFISILFFALLAFGCTGEDGEDGNDGGCIDCYDGTSDGEISDNDDTIVDTDDDILITSVNPSGYIEAASCEGYSEVTILPLNPQLKQTGAYHRGWTDSDHSGHYTVYADVTSTYGQYGFEGDCRRETTSGTVRVKLEGLIKMSDTAKNLNYPNSIKSLVANYHFHDSGHENYGDADASLATAQTEVLNYFDMPDTGVDFSEMSLQGDSTSDAVMAIISATIDYNKDGSQQSAFMKEIAEGILSNDLTLKSQVNAITDSLPIKQIRDNINSMFTELGISADSPPIWELSDHIEYTDLLNRTPDILESFSLDSSSVCNIDTNGYDSFAYPIVFTSIENAIYFATELQGQDISIWSVGTCNQGTDYLCPSIELIKIDELNEILLEPQLLYNGYIGGHELINGEQYFIVENYNTTNIHPTHICNDQIVQFGRNLATLNNNWDSAVGWNNSTAWFIRIPKIFLTN